MRSIRFLSFVASTLMLIASPVAAADERGVHELVKAGEIMPFEAILGRVTSEVRGEYVGAQFDMSSRTYRFRFVDNGNLFNVDVDARTGQRLNRRRSF